MLKLTEDDPEKEELFEIQVRLKEPPKERLSHWLAWNLAILELQQSRNNESTDNHKILKRS